MVKLTLRRSMEITQTIVILSQMTRLCNWPTKGTWCRVWQCKPNSITNHLVTPLMSCQIDRSVRRLRMGLSGRCKMPARRSNHSKWWSIPREQINNLPLLWVSLPSSASPEGKPICEFLRKSIVTTTRNPTTAPIALSLPAKKK